MVDPVKIKGDVKSQVLPEFFKSYSDLKTSLNQQSSWFCWSNDGQTYKHWAEACHARMRYNKDMDNLITAVPNTDDISLAYQRMLINGPFKAVADLISLEREGDHYYIQCTGLDKFPAKVLFNYCIATRLPLEHKQYLNCWAKYCELGFEPTLAFLLSYSVDGKPNTATRIFPNHRHMWLDVGSDWKRIIDGDFVDKSGPFKTDYNNVIPTNVIWDTTKDNNRGLVHMPKEAIAELFGLPIVPPGPPKPQPRRRRGAKLIAEPAFHNLYGNAAVNMAIDPLEQLANPLAGFAFNPVNNQWEPINEPVPQPQVEVAQPHAEPDDDVFDPEDFWAHEDDDDDFDV